MRINNYEDRLSENDQMIPVTDKAVNYKVDVKRHIIAEPDVRLKLIIFLCFRQIVSELPIVLSHYP